MTDYPMTFTSNTPEDIDVSTIVLTPTPEAWAEMQAENSRLGELVEHLRAEIRSLTNEQSEFEDRLKDAVENNEIDADLAKEFADIFDLELSKTYSITITASWSGTVVVPFGSDIDDLELSVNYPEATYSCDADFELDIDEDSLEHETSEYY